MFTSHIVCYNARDNRYWFDMLQVSPRQIDLKLFQKRYNIGLVNLAESAIIFNVRSTNVKALTVEPNAGFLRAQSNLSLLITVKSRNLSDEKIQICYATTTDPKLGYEEAWSEIKKKRIEVRKQIINICLNNQEEQSEQSQQLLKSSGSIKMMRTPRKKSLPKMSGQFSSIVGAMQTKREELSIIKEQKAFKDYLSTGAKARTATKQQIIEHYEKEKKRHFEDEQKEELAYRLEQLQRKYNIQLNQSERLKQQLQITQGKIKDSSVVGLKYEVNQTLGTLCDEHHTSFTGLALLALASFFFGYLFALFV